MLVLSEKYSYSELLDYGGVEDSRHWLADKHPHVELLRQIPPSRRSIGNPVIQLTNISNLIQTFCVYRTPNLNMCLDCIVK